MMTDTYVQKNKDIAFRVIDGIAVLVNPKSGMMYVLNEVGTKMWELMDETRSVSDMCQILFDEYEADKMKIEKDAEIFINELAERELISKES